MASQATHVVELKAGIGEPAFVPLTLGQELAPLSIGKKGMWRIESARMLDVHAFMYFDGHSLFMQSADDNAPAFADGGRVAKTWTEVFAPCTIEIGGTELAFRSLAASEDETQARQPPPSEQMPPTVPGPPRGADMSRMTPQRTAAVPRVSAPPQITASVPRVSAPPQATAPMRRSTSSGGVPAMNAASERPFQQGEFVHKDEDSTRVHPLSTTHATNKPRPAAGEPARPSSGRQPIGDVPSVIIPPDQNYAGSGPYPPMSMGMAAQMHGSHPSQVGMQMRETGMQLQQMQQMQQTGMNGQPGMYGGMQLTNIPMPQVQTAAQKDAVAEAIAQFKAASPPRKASIVLAPFVIVAAMYLLLVDDAPQQARRGAGSASASASIALATSNRAPPPDPRYLVDPRYAPVQDPRLANPALPVDPRLANPALPVDPRLANPALPVDPRLANPALPVDPRLAPPVATDPRLAPVQADPRLAAVDPRLAAVPPNDPRLATTPVPATGGPVVDPGANVDAGVLLPKGERTLERQAIDALARGDRPRAAALYAQLSQLYPQNRAFAEAARILRVGMPPGPEASQPQ